MRVLFAVPRSYNPKQMYREYPLGVGFLGTILRRAGHEVRIFDQNVEGLDDAGLFSLVEQFQPQVVGFSVITPNYPVARQQIRRIKQCYPDIHIVTGGIHSSLFPEDLIEDGAEVVVLGEGEGIIVQLVAAFERGEPPEGLAGVVFSSRAGPLVKTPGWSQISDLDNLPVVDRSSTTSPVHPPLDAGLPGMPTSLRLLLQLHRHHPERWRGDPVAREGHRRNGAFARPLCRAGNLFCG